MTSGWENYRRKRGEHIARSNPEEGTMLVSIHDRWSLTRYACATFLLALFVHSDRATADAAPPLRIGVLSDMSSLYTDNGGKGSVVAAQMAVDDFGGTVLNRKIEIVSADNQNK